ncbi:hypothetical protein [Qipengyuania gaetbuli]|uniref:hypothetical protein n=1 Tax=Qipengyuania gaetbuli TaxID=266952 RepID=UPI001CD1A008|nr:hypothetical protein [Qipengyuania gaetbuli]MCA0910389.1 hypothetical protein [Qipengyuania gaetbuli]
MKKVPATLAALAVVMPLSGCQSFLSAFDLGKHSRASQPVFGEADLEEGRRLLAEGQIGNALPALQRAALNRETAPEAANALGVAYARLGRGDLAERYFRAAVTLAPEETKFAANLDRFYASDLGQDLRTLYAQREEARKAYTEFAKSDEAVRPDMPAEQERVVMSGGQERRITLARGATSSRIALGAPQPLAAPERVRVSVAEVADAPAKPAVRVSVNGQQMHTSASARPAEIRVGATSGYPMRVRIGKEARVSATPARGYPVRVSLNVPKVEQEKK